MGGLFIVGSTIHEARLRAKQGLSRLSLFQCLPCCIAICDLIFNIFHGADHMHSLNTGYVFQGATCRFIGWGMYLGTDANAIWCSITAVLMALNIIKNKKPDFGPYAWKLVTLGFGVPILSASIPLFMGKYGDSGAWCQTVDPVTSNVFQTFWLMAGFFVCIIAYSLIFHKVWIVYRNVDAAGFSQNTKQRKQIAVARYLTFFVLIYAITWAPSMATQLASWFTGSTLTIPFGINCWAVFFANSGCWCNGIAYYNLLRKTKKNSSSSAESTNGDIGSGIDDSSNMRTVTVALQGSGPYSSDGSV
eukprot:TRINITY_DN20130_c0_g1_i1.p1 TRINITY_DN20130_c0_g1~~TRINITY_DN20130_c0_g1_i1.p1  ORF type:complete len:304 (-),score=38.49 TRINITY_DN20130_c0_g1_i1:131-1042(-)